MYTKCRRCDFEAQSAYTVTTKSDLSKIIFSINLLTFNINNYSIVMYFLDMRYSCLFILRKQHAEQVSKAVVTYLRIRKFGSVIIKRSSANAMVVFTFLLSSRSIKNFSIIMSQNREPQTHPRGQPFNDFCYV